jgi:serine/threonine-protein kinase
MKHVQEPIPPIPASPGIAAIIRRAMAKRPADRYPSAGAMAAALAEDDDPTRVMPAAPPHRARRNLVLAATLAALAVLAGLGAWALGNSEDGTPRAAASPSNSTPAPVAVPRVMGLQYATAANRLEAAGLHAVRRLGGYDTNVKGSVVSISQTGRVPRGTTLTLVVSSGPAPAPPPPEDKPGKDHDKKHHGHHHHHQDGDN